MSDPSPSLKALSAVKSYLAAEYDAFSLKIITKELTAIAKVDFSAVSNAQKHYSYDSLQEELAALNEKCATRKSKGVYYTPDDIVEFILTNSIKFFYDELETNRLNRFLPKNLPYEKFCYFNACRNNTFSAFPIDPIVFLFPSIKSCAFYLPEIKATMQNCSQVIIGIGINQSAKSREHTGAEYKIFKCDSAESANLSLLLLNSSLFWWYWVCVSDCWHITSEADIIIGSPPCQGFSMAGARATLIKIQRTSIF